MERAVLAVNATGVETDERAEVEPRLDGVELKLLLRLTLDPLPVGARPRPRDAGIGCAGFHIDYRAARAALVGWWWWWLSLRPDLRRERRIM